MQPAFHHRRIAHYADVMVDHTVKMLDVWQDGQSYDVDDEMMRLTMQIAGSTLFGSDVDEAANRVGAAIGVLQTISAMEFRAGFSLPCRKQPQVSSSRECRRPSRAGPSIPST